MSISEFEYDKSDSDAGGGERPRSGIFPLRIPRRSRYNGQRTTLSPKDKTIHGWSIKFSKFPSDRSFGYVVMYPQAKAECIEEPLKVLTTRFNFQEPGLIISVIGELSEDLSLQWTLNTFKDSLSLTLRTTGGWTLTSGLDNPLNRLVSEAHRCRRSEPVPAMGVARWDEKLLRRSENTLPARRDNEKTYLENNHSMFVFFEKGMSRLNVQNDLIVRLEKFLIQRARMDFRALAVVKLLVGGGLVHLQKIHQAVTNNIPVLILQGTGGAADVLATAMDESDDDIPDSDDDVPSEDGSETDEAKASRIKLQATKIAVYCRNNPDLLRKFDLSDVTTAAALQIAFLKSALKAPRLSCKDRISAFLCWDHDLSSLQTLSQALLQDVDMEALVTQKPKLLGQMLKNALFTRHFLTQVVSFLKTSHIQALYQDSKDIMFPDIQTAPWKVTFVNIRELLKSLYPPLESIGFYFQKSDHNLTSSEEKIVHLFLWSVLSNRESVSRVLWEEVPEPLLAALVAYKILTQQSKKFKRPMLALDRHASMFETLAVELLDQYHQTSVEHTRAVLSKKSLTWGKVSSFRMAIESQAVISHESFEPVINEVWMGDLANSNSRWKVFWYALFQMRFCLDFKRAKGIKEICKSSTSAPVIKYFSFMLSYLAFLAAYTINLLLGPSEQVPALSWLVALWVFAALVEEISQVTRFRGLSLMTTLIFGPHLLFTVGFILRNPHRVLDYQWGTLLLSIALAFFYLSALRFFLAFRALGIKVVMMREMMFNMVIFMMIMITIMFGYGIAIEVTLFPEASISEHGARNLLRRPVWQLFGELLLDEIESMPECPDNSTGDGDDGCPSDLGKRIAPAMTAIYMFITNVLLLNLLIAIFSSTYRKVESSAVRYLNYESYRLAMEFAVRSYFPPPLSLLENVYTLVRRCMRCQGSTFEDLAQEIHSQAVEEGMEVHKSKEDVRWEEAMQDRYLERVQERELQLSPGSADDILASTLPRPPQAFNSGRRESNFSLDGPSPSEELVSFRRVFTKQMSELNDRLYRIESQLHANSREIKTTLTRQAGFDRESVKKKDEEDSRC